MRTRSIQTLCNRLTSYIYTPKWGFCLDTKVSRSKFIVRNTATKWMETQWEKERKKWTKRQTQYTPFFLFSIWSSSVSIVCQWFELIHALLLFGFKTIQRIGVQSKPWKSIDSHFHPFDSDFDGRYSRFSFLYCDMFAFIFAVYML